MRFHVSGEASKTFGKNGDLNPPDELMAVVDIENQNPRRVGAAFLLCPIGHAEVEISFRSGLTEDEGGESDKQA
jgi:hypothetical protein